MGKQPFTIRSVADLELLLKPGAGGWGRRRVQVVLELPGFDAADRSQYERRLSNSLSSCGCAEGALLGLGAAGLAATAGMHGTQTWSIGSVTATALWTLAAFVMRVLVGKVTGLAFARHRAQRIANQLRLRMESESSSMPSRVQELIP